MRTSNPVLSDKIFDGVRPRGAVTNVMTIDGTINKSIIAVGVTLAVATWSFSAPSLSGLFYPALILGLVLGLVVSFKPTMAPILTLPYAGAEGVFLGLLSSVMEARYPGIVFQAIIFTSGTLFTLLLAYKSGLIQVTERFRKIVTIGIVAIMATYLLSFLLSFAGMQFSFLYDASPFSIGLSFLIVGFAAMSLVLDFDMIERAAKSGSQEKYMEWYGAFALLVSLIWLYVEILRLLAKLQSRD